MSTDHPLRPVRQMLNALLVEMDSLCFGMFEAEIEGGLRSITTEELLCAMPMQVFYSIRSRRQSMEQTQYNFLFRWFVGLTLDNSAWAPAVSLMNPDRLIRHDALAEHFNLMHQQPQEKNLISGEHFSVDGTLVQVWAGYKSFIPKVGGDSVGNGNPTDFHREKRSNATRRASTDADARLDCRGDMASRLRGMGCTLCADNGDDAKELVNALQEINVITHVAQNTSGGCTVVPDSIEASDGYVISIQNRKLFEQGVGWAKTVGRICQAMVCSHKRVDQVFVLTKAAYNLARMGTLGQKCPRMT